MEKKDIAFDYINRLLFVDSSAEKDIPNDLNLNEKDKEELLHILNNIKAISQKPQPELMEFQIKNIEKMQSNMDNTIDTMMNLKNSIQDVIKDSKRAYKYVLWMYIVAFYFGIALLIVALVFAAYDKMILSIAFGSVGLIDVVSHFIFKPPLELQSSRANLAQLMVILTNWFADVMNLNSYFAQSGKPITMAEIKDISSKQNHNTEMMLEFIEKYCEPGKPKSKVE